LLLLTISVRMRKMTAAEAFDHIPFNSVRTSRKIIQYTKL